MFNFGLVLVFAVLQTASRNSEAFILQESGASESSVNFKYTTNGYDYVVENRTVVSIAPTGDGSDAEHVNLTGTMQLTTWSPGLFDFAKNAKVLDLSNNSIASIPKDGFRNLKKIESLHLSDNQLEHLKNTPFANLSTLKNLDLTNNRIEKLQAGYLFGLSNQTDISILGNNLSSISTWLFDDPNGQDLEIDELEMIKCGPEANSDNNFKACIRDGTLEKVEFLHNNETLESHCRQVTVYGWTREIFLNGSGIATFAPGWYRLQNFTIGALSLRDNNIVNLSSEIFSQLPQKIKEIDLSGNKIERMIKGSMSNPFLETLILSNNSISEIEDGTFEGSNLNELNLSSNRLTSTKFVSTLPASLSTLILSKNQIGDLPPNAFSAFKHLRHLDLSDNNIIEIKNSTLSGFTKMSVLDLSNNKIAKIEPGSFKGYVELDLLNLQKNNLAILPVGIFEGIDWIRTIDLSFNNLTRVSENSFPNTLRSKELILSHNQIEVLEKGAFLINTVDYFVLNLSHNKIKKIEHGAFRMECGELDLSNNLLSQPDGEVFEGIRKMYNLDLQNNGIERIEKGFAKYFHQNKKSFTLNLSNNPIRKLQNGALFGIIKDPWTIVEVNGTPIELIQGGVFEDI